MTWWTSFARSPWVAVVLVVAAVAALAASVRSTRRPADTVPGWYFTDDGGKTYFRDTAERVPPFDHNGRPAVRAHVFVGRDGKPFVAWLERYTDAAAAVLRAVRPNGTPVRLMTPAEGVVVGRGKQHRRMTDADWLPGGNDETNALALRMLRDVKCPDGSPATELPED